jgi:hypothetical protein
MSAQVFMFAYEDNELEGTQTLRLERDFEVQSSNASWTYIMQSSLS